MHALHLNSPKCCSNDRLTAGTCICSGAIRKMTGCITITIKVMIVIMMMMIILVVIIVVITVILTVIITTIITLFSS